MKTLQAAPSMTVLKATGSPHLKAAKQSPERSAIYEAAKCNSEAATQANKRTIEAREARDSGGGAAPAAGRSSLAPPWETEAA
jgi:hypothetical protein